MLQMFKNNTVGVSRSHQKDKHGAIEWSWCSPIHFWSVFVVQIRFEGFCQFCQIYERNQLKINTWRSLQMAFTKKSLGISVQNNVQLILIVSPMFMKQLPSGFFFVVTAGTAVITKNQRNPKLRVEFRKIFIVFEKTQTSDRARFWVFSKTINIFRNSILTDECRWFLGITPVPAVTTKKNGR